MINASPSLLFLPNNLEKGVIGKHLQFQHLPAYAKFLLENKLDEFAIEQLKLERELNIPVFRLLSAVSEAELIKRVTQDLSSILISLSRNRMDSFIQNYSQEWIFNQATLIPIDEFGPEDIAMKSFIRRRLFRNFLSDYTKDVGLFSKILEELDSFMAEMDSISFGILVNNQKDLFKQAQALYHLGHWVWDLSDNQTTWSDELFHIYELDPKTEPTFDLASLNHPEDASFVQDQMRISRETLQPHDFYYRIVLGDGRIKFLHAKGKVLADKNGKACKMYGTLQDVTSQQLIESEIKNNQNFIQKIANITPSIIGVLNIKIGKYLFINEALKTSLGYETKEVFEKGLAFFIEILHPDDLPVITKEIENSLNSANNYVPVNNEEQIYEFTARMRHRDGYYKWFHNYVTVFERQEDNQVMDVIFVSADITKQMTTTEELLKKSEEVKRNEDRYHKMIEEVEDYAILSLSRDGIVENWNKGAEKIKGYKSEEIVGKSFRLFYPLADQQSNLPEKLIEKALKDGFVNHEGWRVRKDGTTFWGYVVITALHDSTGEIIGFSKVTRDLTERKEAENHLRKFAEDVERKNIELVQKNKELESFSYVASHDLKEPLRKIMIFSNRIIENNQLSDQSKDYFNRIQKACFRMQTLIDGLLDYSRSNLVESNFEETDLNLLVDEVKKELSDIIEEKNIVIEAARLPIVKVAQFQFLQLFLNIVSNAIKYGKKDAPLHINISSSIVAEGEKNDPENKGQKFYKISITDNGIGFDPEYAERIFELFQRLHGNAEYTGSGIGLAICKRIMEHHKGKITATGIPGVGATFDIFLPVK